MKHYLIAGAVALALFVPFCAAICPGSDMEPERTVPLTTADSLKIRALTLRYQCEVKVNELEIEKKMNGYKWKEVQPVPISASEPIKYKNHPPE